MGAEDPLFVLYTSGECLLANHYYRDLPTTRRPPARVAAESLSRISHLPVVVFSLVILPSLLPPQAPRAHPKA